MRLKNQLKTFWKSNKLIVKEVDSNNIIVNPIEITYSEKILPNGNK